MISLPAIGDTIGYHGNLDATLQASWAMRLGGAWPVYDVEASGKRDSVVNLAETCKASPTSIPAAFGVTVGDGESVVLSDLQVRGAPGGLATLSASYRVRNARETADDVAAGLVSRRISVRWIERQEMLEHYAARLAKANNESFNGILFALWLDEPDPDLRAAFSVRVEESDGTVHVYALGDDSSPAPFTGSGYTKAIAERYAMGIQYTSMRMVQVDVAETWRAAPDIVSPNANTIMKGLPDNHKPLFSMEENGSVKFTWMLQSDSCAQGADGFERTCSYLGVPSTMMPDPVPTMWGDTPIDALLHPSPDEE